METLPQRKSLRLPEHDYGQNGYYFVTICTAERRGDILSKIRPNERAIPDHPFMEHRPGVGAIINRPPVQPILTPWGEIVEQAIGEIPNHYPGVGIDCYIIMPDHVHLIVILDQIGADGRQIAAPTTKLSTIIQQFKRAVSRRIGRSIWQRSYYDHVIRNERDLNAIREYILYNPLKNSLPWVPCAGRGNVRIGKENT